MIITKERIVNFFKNRCSAEEADEIYRYLQENPEWISMIYYNDEAWENFRYTEDMPEEWTQQLMETINAEKSVREGRFRWIKGFKVAAAVIGILLGTGAFWQRYEKRHGPSAADTAMDAGKDTTLINGKRVLERVMLDDGSVVELYPSSRLTFHLGFQRDKRTVLLSG